MNVRKMNEYELRWIYVYIVYNCISDKLLFSDVMYIGQTKNLKERHYHHLYINHQKTVCDKFLSTHKYEFIPLMCGFAKDIDCMEKYLIREWCTDFNEGMGLNCTMGGLDGGAGCKPIDQFDKCGAYIKTFFGGAKEICETYGYKYPSAITRCCKGKISSYMGFMWKYHINNPTQIEPHRKNYAGKRVVYQYTLDWDFIKEWDSVRTIERELKINHGDIVRCCNNPQRSYKTYRFSYEKV